MKATLGSVITARNREIHPGSIASTRGLLRRQMPRLAACNLDRATIDLPEQFGLVARDEVDHIRLQRGIGGKAGGLPHRFLRPIGIAAAHLGKAADQGDGVVRRLRCHCILRLRLLVAAVLLFLIALVRGSLRQTGQRAANLHRRRCSEIGARRHGRDMRGVEDIGSGAGRMGSGGRDVTDNGNAGRQHVCDNLAHAGRETARRIQTQNDDLGMSFACLGQGVFHVTGRCRPDRSFDRDGQRKLAVVLPRRDGKGRDNQSYRCSGRNKSRPYGLHSKDSLIEMTWGVLHKSQYARDWRSAAFPRPVIPADVLRCRKSRPATITKPAQDPI